jgi:hypothetical protein
MRVPWFVLLGAAVVVFLSGLWVGRWAIAWQLLGGGARVGSGRPRDGESSGGAVVGGVERVVELQERARVAAETAREAYARWREQGERR